MIVGREITIKRTIKKRSIKYIPKRKQRRLRAIPFQGAIKNIVIAILKKFTI